MVDVGSVVFRRAALLVTVFGIAFWSAQTISARTRAPAMPALVSEAQTIDGIRFVTAEQALGAHQAQDTESPLFVDVRTGTEFEAMHIPGAQNVQDFQLPDMVGQFPANKAWVMYCTCPDDRLAKWAVDAIQHMGVPNAVVLQHGLGAWQAAGGDVAVPDGAEGAVRQGCGCTLGAEALKLWAIERAQNPSQAAAGRP
jgi:rhodanese-related sulfurtransferase